MRYLKGSIVLSDTKDYPLLRRVLHCSFVTPDQLFQFMKLDYCASSRNAFDNRVRRLLAHQLLFRHEIPTMNRGVVYSVSPAGMSELIGQGEFYSKSMNSAKIAHGHVQHALELNDVHLALKRTGELVRWTPESDVQSRNEFTNIGFVKDYDAAVAVRIEGQEYTFALEYERTLKAKCRYDAIRRKVEAEGEFHHFLYLVPNHDLLTFLIDRFKNCGRTVHFGLRKDFLADNLGLPVRDNHSPISTAFYTVLAAPPNPECRAKSALQMPLLYPLRCF